MFALAHFCGEVMRGEMSNRKFNWYGLIRRDVLLAVVSDFGYTVL